MLHDAASLGNFRRLRQLSTTRASSVLPIPLACHLTLFHCLFNNL